MAHIFIQKKATVISLVKAKTSAAASGDIAIHPNEGTISPERASIKINQSKPFLDFISVFNA